MRFLLVVVGIVGIQCLHLKLLVLAEAGPCLVRVKLHFDTIFLTLIGYNTYYQPSGGFAVDPASLSNQDPSMTANESQGTSTWDAAGELPNANPVTDFALTYGTTS